MATSVCLDEAIHETEPQLVMGCLQHEFYIIREEEKEEDEEAGGGGVSFPNAL